MAYYPPMPMMMQPGMGPMMHQPPMARQYMVPQPWMQGYGVGGSPPGQPQAQAIAPPPPGGRFALSPAPSPTTPMGTAAVIGASSDNLLHMAAENKARAERKKAERIAKHNARVSSGQTAGTVLGGLAGAAIGLAAPPFAPLIAAGGAAIGGQVGRAAAGGGPGFGHAAVPITQGIQSIPRVRRDYREATRAAAVQQFVKSLPPEHYAAYVNMPPSVAYQFNQGNFDMFEKWLPMYQSAQMAAQPAIQPASQPTHTYRPPPAI